MKLCETCRRTFSGKAWKCPECGHSPGQAGGFISFAPESATFYEHFPPDSFQRLAPLEAQHFWFRARNNLIIWALHKWFPEKGKLMEIGCGTGFVLSRIEKDFPKLELCGSEIYSDGLKFASERLFRTELLQMDALNIPYQGEFDVIGLFDTLEHIQQDEAVLAQVHRALVPGGGLLITVPQHGFLWSYLDEFSGHLRRYERNELTDKVRKSGFRVVAVSSFVFLLLPVLWLTRLRKRKSDSKFDPGAELKLYPPLNLALGLVLSLENLLIRMGLRFPWGGSLFLVARKD